MSRPFKKEYKEAREWCSKYDLPDPALKYLLNKNSAKKRGIKWKLSFDEWWSLWKPHYSKRGRKSMQKCLCRELDSGCYEVGNVRIDYVKANSQERCLVNNIKYKWKPNSSRSYIPEWHIPNLKEYEEDKLY